MKSPEHSIFLESIEYIRSQIGLTGLSLVQQAILERIIHSSGDLSMQSFLRFSPNACEEAMKALKNGAGILTDTNMAKVAVSSVAKKTLNSNVTCILEMVPDSVDLASTTRSAIGMKTTWLDLARKDKFVAAPIVVVGSAPTALMTLLDLIEGGYEKPSLIIGMPVGFIGVSESKNRLLNSDCSYIVLEGSKGGASIASATINALLRASE